MIRSLAFILLVLIIAVSCKSPKDEVKGVVLNPKQMQAVLWDILQADAFTQTFISKDSTKNATVENAVLQKKIFELHKVRKEDYLESYNYYTARPNEMRVILDSITAKADRERNTVMQERYSGIKPMEN